MCDTGRKTPPPGSYSTIERRTLLPIRQFGSHVCYPLVRLLATLGIPATALSLLQIPLGFLAAVLIVRAPQAACLLFFLAIFLDFLDGEVARATGTDSVLGALVDQVSEPYSRNHDDRWPRGGRPVTWRDRSRLRTSLSFIKLSAVSRGPRSSPGDIQC